MESREKKEDLIVRFFEELQNTFVKPFTMFPNKSKKKKVSFLISEENSTRADSETPRD